MWRCFLKLCKNYSLKELQLQKRETKQNFLKISDDVAWNISDCYSNTYVLKSSWIFKLETAWGFDVDKFAKSKWCWVKYRA